MWDAKPARAGPPQAPWLPRLQRIEVAHPGKSPSPAPAAHGPGMGRLLWGDNLPAMHALLAEGYAGKLRLVYLDPPPLAAADDAPRPRGRVGSRPAADRERWSDGLDGYLGMLYPRLLLVRELLADGGSLYVHAGPEASAYVRVLLDEVFGPESFRNQVAWRRGPAHGDPARFGRNCDHLLFCTKGDGWTWNEPVGPVSDGYLATFTRRDERGPYTTQPLHRPANGAAPTPWRGRMPPPGRAWAWTPQQLDAWDAEGRIAWSRTGAPRLKRHLGEVKGAPLQEVWTDLPALLPHHAEHTGFEAQKPAALLERILLASSNEGDLVADFFHGSGTTALVAERLGRRWVGVDSAKAAIQLARARLLAQGGRPFAVDRVGEAPAPQAAGARPGPRIEASLRSEPAGAGHHAVRLAIEGYAPAAPHVPGPGKGFLALLDSWSVDWDHDGQVFRGAWHEVRGRGKAAKPIATVAEATLAGGRRYEVWVRAVDAFGDEAAAAASLDLR